jgi:hypothetical protein
MIKKLCCTAVILALTTSAAGAHDARASKDAAKVTVVYEKELPNVPGKSMKGVLVEYGPGGFDEAHTHPSSAFISGTQFISVIPPEAERRRVMWRGRDRPRAGSPSSC